MEFFHTFFPGSKKSAAVRSLFESEGARKCQLIHAGLLSSRTRTCRTPLSGVQLHDGVTGKTYFWNRRTRATVWKSPPGVKVVWVGERTEEGGIWNWHRATRVSTCDLPSAAS